MESLLFALTFLAALGAGLISGLFFAFSSFVMTALHRLPSATGISAMQSINVAVLNPLFFAAFFGTAVLCILLVLAGLIRWPESDAIYLIVDALLYLAGTILVTMVCNVLDGMEPLADRRRSCCRGILHHGLGSLAELGPLAGHSHAGSFSCAASSVITASSSDTNAS
jgi:uncharacterized membrane protein